MPRIRQLTSIYIHQITQTIVHINLQNLHVAQHLYNHNSRRLIDGKRWEISRVHSTASDRQTFMHVISRRSRVTAVTLLQFET